MTSTVLDARTERWWVPMLRGVAAVLFGVLAIVTPLAGLLALVFLWGVYAFVDGVLGLVVAYHAGRRGGRWGWSALAGVAGIAAGIVTFAYPGITSLVLLFIIGGWAIAVGVIEIVASFEQRKERAGGAGWLFLAGASSAIFGALVFAFPGSGALALVWTIGVFAIVFGAMRIGLGLGLRRLRSTTTTTGFPGQAAPATG